MSTTDRDHRFFPLWSEVVDVASATELLSWDQETYMPPRGQQGRGRVLATLAGIEHEKLTSPALSDALDELAQRAEPDSDLAAQVREARRRVRRATAIPGDLTRRLAEARSAGIAAWQSARKVADFAQFAPQLEQLVGLAREVAEHVAPVVDESQSVSLYDALLDEYEPGARTAELEPLFASLCEHLSPLVRAAADSGVVVDEAPVRGSFPAEKQLAFGRQVAQQMGFDFAAGRLDASTHPFCSGFNEGDVRLTWRWQEDDVRAALFGIMHEAGHGLYEQGLPPAWSRTPLGTAVSMGIHESQSRLWENLVGRSRAFWEWGLPHYGRVFPDKRDATVDALYPALNTVRPSFVRVEADEGTYNLHIAVRFGIERALFAGELAVADLPGAWDDAYEDLLGIRPPDAKLGVLQDIHWSMGAFGYFPTYTLGNLMACQLFRAAADALGDLDGQLARGELEPLLTWLRANVHCHGSRYTAGELIERATGKPLAADAFLEHIRATTARVYGVGA